MTKQAHQVTDYYDAAKLMVLPHIEANRINRFDSFYDKLVIKTQTDLGAQDLAFNIYSDFILYVNQMSKIKNGSKFVKQIDGVWHNVIVNMTGNREGNRIIGLHSKELNKLVVIDEPTMFLQIKQGTLCRVKRFKNNQKTIK